MMLKDVSSLEVVCYQGTEGYDDRFDDGVRFILEKLDEIPAVDPESLRPKGRWELQVKSFYMDNYDESIELAVYIAASCSECGENHPKPHSSGQVYSHHIYAPEDADDDFRFDQDEERAKLLNEFMRMLNGGEMRLVNYCPNCGADMRCMGDD